MLYRNERPILAILSDTFSSLSYLDTNHSRDEFLLSLSDLVSKFECIGDTRGGEAGSRTGVTVSFQSDCDPRSQLTNGFEFAGST
jgi:hypothetical protein